MPRQSSYDKFPVVAAGPAEECSTGWRAIAERLAASLRGHRVMCVECYPGAFVSQILEGLATHLERPVIFLSDECLKSTEELHGLLDPLLGTDRVFGRMSGISLEDYFNVERIHAMRAAVKRAAQQG